MTTESVIPFRRDEVKTDVMAELSKGVDALLAAVDAGASPRELEGSVWQLVLTVGRLLLTYALALACRRVTEQDLRRRGLSRRDVWLRMDEDYHVSLTTTLGPVRVPVFAYRDRSSGLGTVTRAPARKQLFPLYPRCRSSEACVEWEARLGSEHPFRKAQEALRFFTHGAVELEDTTIARHMVRVGLLVDRSWLYRPVEEVGEILRTRATRDAESEQPVLYVSSDAHALRRYVDETWDAQWKMANGLRLWCVDRHNGAIIHIGGEYTWGDCHVVKGALASLVASGHLPADGNYGDGVTARIVFISDGMPWFEDHLLPLLPSAVAVLDAYHALERLGDYAATRFGRGTPRAKDWYDKAVRTLLGQRPPKRAKGKRRKGHKKTRRTSRPKVETPPPGADLNRTPAAEALLDLLAVGRIPKAVAEAHAQLVAYIEHNAARMDFTRYRQLGYQIGSGAMESLHRTGSQARLKIPGGRWLRETSQAIFNLRMMTLAGRWRAFWDQPDITQQLAAAFAAPANDDTTCHAEAA